MKKILFYVFSFFLLQIGNINDALAVTYRLQRVTNVKAGEKYVFEQAGRVMKNTISNNALETTNSGPRGIVRGGQMPLPNQRQ